MKNKNIKALGFVEVLIAIAVVGIVSAVFLTIAGQAMKNLIKTERIESMARIAADGANIAQEIANQEKSGLSSGVDFFPSDASDVGYCYFPLREENGGDVSYSFLIEDEWGSQAFRAIAKDAVTARDDFLLYDSMYEDYFLVMCIDSIDDAGTSWANVRFIVGDVNVAGQATTDSDVSDFTYYAVIDL